MFRKILPVRLRLIALLSIIFLSAAFYLILIHATKSSVSEQLMLRELTVAKAIAGNLQSTFEVIGNSTAFRAQLKNKDIKDETLVHDMEVFMDQWRDSGLISGIILTDNKGIVRFNTNITRVSDIGADVSDRGYFSWAKTQTEEGKYYVDLPRESRLGASKGQMIIPVASPVITNGAFTGVYVTAVKLNPLTERFLETIKISNQTNVYLIDHNKDVLYSSTDSEALSEDIKKEFDFNNEGSFRDDGRLFAYAPVLLADQRWLIAVASPYEEVLNLPLPFYLRQVTALILVALITLIFGVAAYREGQNRLK